MSISIRHQTRPIISESTGVDYESKLWGSHDLEPSPIYLGGLKLRYCLDDLKGISGTVLEVGCGGGALARAIKRHRPDLHIYGADLSISALRVATHKETGVRYSAGNAHHLPYASETFDAIVVLDVLEHLQQPGAALIELSRVLRRGGTFHLFCPVEGDKRCLHGMLHALGWDAKEHLIGHIQHFSANSLEEMLSRNGFSIVRSRWSGHLFNQLVDVAYFSSLRYSGRQKEASIEGNLASGSDRLLGKLLRTATRLVAIGSYFESTMARSIVGSGAHHMCLKQSESTQV